MPLSLFKCERDRLVKVQKSDREGMPGLPLHGDTVASPTSGCVWVLSLADWPPNRGHKVVLCALAVVDQPITSKHAKLSVSSSSKGRGSRGETYDCEASETRIRGRSRSSFRRWLCSVKRRSLSSDMDCLCGLTFIVANREDVGR